MVNALEKALEDGDAAALRTALDAGVTWSPRAESEGLTPLHVAAANGQLECARLLLDRGADTDAKTAVRRGRERRSQLPTLYNL